MADAVFISFFNDAARLLQTHFPKLWSIAFEGHCPTPYLFVHEGWAVTHHFLGLAAIAGVAVGLTLTLQANKRMAIATPNFRNAWYFYSLSFLFFASMNTSAIFYHCIYSPRLYRQSLGTVVSQNMLINPFVTYVAHVVDVCSTCCSCLCFLFGRLYHIKFFTGDSLCSGLTFGVVCIFFFGFYGLRESESEDYATVVPFLSETLYPGTLGFVVLVLPLCSWPAQKWLLLVAGFVALAVAFGCVALEHQLCAMFGVALTSPFWCFALCDVLFLILAQLIDCSSTTPANLATVAEANMTKAKTVTNPKKSK